MAVNLEMCHASQNSVFVKRGITVHHKLPMYQGNTHLYYYGINLVRSRDNESMKSTPLKDEKG